MRRAVGLVVANAVWIGLLCCSTAAEARDAVVTSFDGTPIVTHFYSPAGLASGERVPTVLYGSGYGYRGPNTPDAGGGVRLGQGDYRDDDHGARGGADPLPVSVTVRDRLALRVAATRRADGQQLLGDTVDRQLEACDRD